LWQIIENAVSEMLLIALNILNNQLILNCNKFQYNLLRFRGVLGESPSLNLGGAKGDERNVVGRRAVATQAGEGVLLLQV
jgi:hypothetical protein